MALRINAENFEEKVLKADKYGLCVVVSEECLEDNGYDPDDFDL